MLAYILTFLAFIYYLTGSSLLYLSLHDNAWDLGIFNQVLYNTASFNPFAYSFRSFGNYLGDHFSPILLFVAPLAAFKTSLPILAVQAGGLALAGLFIYLLAKILIKNNWLSLTVALSFWINPFTLNIANFDFHPDFAFPLFFFAAFYFLARSSRHPESAAEGSFVLLRTGSGFFGSLDLRMTERNNRYLLCSFICIFLLQLVREDAFLLILPFAIMAFTKFKARKLAVYSFLFCFIYSALVILVIMPLLRDGGSSPLAEHYPYLGRSIGEIGLNIAKNPLIVVRKFLGVPERTTLLKFFGSAGFLAFLSPGLLLLSAPIFLAHFLSVVPMRINLEGHYPAELLAFMYVAVVFGLARLTSTPYLRHPEVSDPKDLKSEILLRLSRIRMTEGRFSNLVAAYLVVISVVSFILFSPFPPSKSANVDRFTVTGHHQLFFQLIKMIPDGVSVSAQTNLVPALAFRQDVYEFPDLREADYVFLDESGAVSGQSITWGYYQKKDNLPNCGYRLIKDEDGFKIYKKDPGFNLLRLLGC